MSEATILVATALVAASQAQAQESTMSADLELLRSLVPEIPDVTLQNMQDITPEEVRILRATPGTRRRFEGDFNSDGQRDLALFGQYVDGDTARSLVLIATQQAGRWQRAALLQFPQPFIIGLQHPQGLFVAFCLGCDFGGRISWSGSRYEFIPSPPAGVEP